MMNKSSRQRNRRMPYRLMLLMMLLVLLTIASPNVKANVPFANIEKTNGGYLLSDENIIALANYIQELQNENVRLQSVVDALNKSLQEERTIAEKLLDEKDYVIDLQVRQIDDLKFLYENSKPTIIDKANSVLGGAGIAAIIILLSQML